MRKEIRLREALFTRLPESDVFRSADRAAWDMVTLPHTWNAEDGQDGGEPYYRGECFYSISVPAPTPGKRQFIQFEGANHVARVWLNGTYLGEHRGGFSTFRFELTEHLDKEGGELLVAVNNGPETHVYPQQADFTFFGGLYRPVTFIEVSPAHFDLMKKGTLGVFVTPDRELVRVDAFPVNFGADAEVRCRVLDAAGEEKASAKVAAEPHSMLALEVFQPRLWDGLEDPYLYRAELTLIDGGEETDRVVVPFGFRTFRVDPEQGFFLNGRAYPLRGVSRHQDRLDKGWAISEADHEEDLDLICEVGATTIRLAHYQHAQYFYDLCDQRGQVLWAEIPFISVFDPSPAARENTLSQMTELVAQNYNHPSICFWGIANEITIAGESPALLENLKEVAALTKKLDPSRLTTMAHVSMVPLDSPHLQLTDVLSYNHYFGWYSGKVEDNGPWLDHFHETHPERALGISEYGAECVMGWHSAEPKVRDYTEEYQAYYHEEMIKTINARPYLWATHVWNMFDFAADARDEGGSRGRNNKGLVTFDRKTKKDSFYAYKAAWSREPLVYIAGRRFVDRAPGQRKLKVYSNQPEIALFLNGEEIAKSSDGPFFYFEQLPLELGENEITAKAPCGLSDTITLNGVTEPNPDYVLPQEEEEDAEGVRNWFESLTTDVKEIRVHEGYYSIKDKIGALLYSEEAAEVLKQSMLAAFGKGMTKMFDKMMQPGESGGMLSGMDIETLLRMAGSNVPEGFPVMLNEKLNKIKRVEG